MLVDSGVDGVLVLAPMAAKSFDRPLSMVTALERAIRVMFNRALRNEVLALSRSGMEVTVLAPMLTNSPSCDRT